MTEHMSQLAVALYSTIAGLQIAGGTVNVAEMPRGERPSPDFEARIDSLKVPVWQAQAYSRELGERYSFVIVDSDQPVTLKVKSKLYLRDARLRPQRLGTTLRTQGREATLVLPGPGQYSFEPNGPIRNLFVIVNPLERTEDIPDFKVIRFGPGIHRVPGDVVKLTSGQTLYLASGAVLQAAINIENARDVKIMGRGIIDGSPWRWLRGPQNQLVRIKNSQNVAIRDVSIRGSYGWTVVPFRSRNITIENLKIFNDRALNDDGIDIVSSSNVRISNSLIRTDDDCIAIKGLRLDNDPELKLDPIRDITVDNCVLWTSRARIALLGHESEATEMSRIMFSNIHALYTAQAAFMLEPGEDMVLRDVVFQNMTVNGTGKHEVFLIRPIVNQYMKYKRVPGRVDGVTIRDLTLLNVPSDRAVFIIRGHDQTRDVRNVRIENVTLSGRGRGFHVTESYRFTSGIRVNGVTTDRDEELPPILVPAKP